MSEILQPVLFLAMAAVCVPAAITLWLLYGRLAEFHAEVWRQLGSPTLLYRQSHASHSKVRHLIWSAQYRALGDRLVTRYVRTMRVLTVVAFLIFLASVANGLFGHT